MTAPRWFTNEEMLEEAATLQERCACAFGEECSQCVAAAMLRQAAAEGQENWEARWKALAVQAADAALQNYASVVPWGSHTLTVMAKIEEANPATPTEPTPSPVPSTLLLHLLSLRACVEAFKDPAGKLPSEIGDRLLASYIDVPDPEGGNPEALGQ